MNEPDLRNNLLGHALLLGIGSEILFLWRVRTTNLKKQYFFGGSFHWPLFLLDCLLHAGLALVGASLAYLAFDTPLLEKYQAYRTFGCLMLGFLSEHSLPLFLDLVVAEIETLVMRRRHKLDED